MAKSQAKYKKLLDVKVKRTPHAYEEGYLVFVRRQEVVTNDRFHKLYKRGGQPRKILKVLQDT